MLAVYCGEGGRAGAGGQGPQGKGRALSRRSLPSLVRLRSLGLDYTGCLLGLSPRIKKQIPHMMVSESQK